MAVICAGVAISLATSCSCWGRVSMTSEMLGISSQRTVSVLSLCVVVVLVVSGMSHVTSCVNFPISG